tara:strand:+ start:422 stop:769 length:348 start_codon:yes stop_codon:yes gene_type:complete
MEDFKDIIKEWLDIEEDIKMKQKEIKEKKQRFSKLSEYIITFMNKQEKQVCNIGSHGSIVLKNRKSSSLNKTSLEKFFISYMKISEEEAKNMIDEMNKAKTVKETQFVKLVKNDL